VDVSGGGTRSGTVPVVPQVLEEWKSLPSKDAVMELKRERERDSSEEME
jgi:hypothetical protein